MPTANELRGDIDGFLRLLTAADIAIFTNPVVARRSSSGSDRVSWKSATGGALSLFNIHRIQAYRSWVAEGSYSAVLYDGALLQMSFEVVGNQVIRHRLAYVPTPLELDSAWLRSDPFLEVFDTHLAAAEHNDFCLRGSVRFDFDLEAAAVEHPAAHLTFGGDGVRIPLIGPVSVGHFARFVFHNFYPQLWEAHTFLRTLRQRRGERTISLPEQERIHLAWRETA